MRWIIALAYFLLAVSVADAAPAVFWGSDPIGPGQTAMLYGGEFSGNAVVEGWRVDDAAISDPKASATAAPQSAARKLDVLQASRECLKVLLPADWAPGLFALKIRNADGESAPTYLNRAEVWWWLGGENDRAYAGEELRVFGKNFGEKTRAWLAGTGGPAIELKILQAGKYSVRCQLPADMQPGTYAVWLHNGFGGSSGFGNPLTVPVVRRVPWPATVLNVREFGATADGTADDTWAIQAALAAAEKNGGGVVYLPRGTYKITGKLIVPAKTTLKGESRETVSLMIPWNTTAEIDSVIAGDGDFAVEDLSITALTARRMISCPLRPQLAESLSFAMSLQLLPDADWGHNVHLRRLCLRQLRRALGVGEVALRPHGWAIGLIGQDMEVSDCDIVSSDGAVNLHGRHIVIERNRIASASRHQEVEECVFADNSIRDTDMDNTGNCFEGKAYRLYIANNKIQDTYGWDREAITFDVPYGHNWMGQVKMSSPTVMTLQGGAVDSWGQNWQTDALKGLGVMIVSGKGLGQFIPIVGNNGRNITLERPWVIEPDATSWVVIRTIKNQVVLTGNQIEDAGKAIQLYANSYGFIVDGNTARRAGGMYGSCRDYIRGGTRRCYSSCAFNQWLNNTISEGGVYARDGITFGDLGPNADFSTLTNPVTTSAMGNVVRNNTVSGDVRVGMGSDVGVNPRASLKRGRDTVIEGNRISDTPGSLTNASGGAMKGLVISGLFEDTLLRGNQVAPCLLPLSDDGKDTWINPAERLGYQIESARSVVGDILELQELRTECRALLDKPDDATTRSACDALRGKLWAVIAGKCPQVPADLLTSLTGLRYDIKPASDFFDAILGGKPGGSTLSIHLRTQPWSPELTVQAALLPPTGGAVNAKAASVSLPPNTVKTLPCGIEAPQGSGITALSLQLTVTLGNVSLVHKEPLAFNRRDLRAWLVSIPGNQGGWQAIPSGGKDVDLAKHLGTTATTAYLASGVEVSEPASAVLDIGCQGAEADFYLNDQWVASLSQHQLGRSAKPQNAKTVRVPLEKGANLLLCKVTPDSAPTDLPRTLRAGFITDPWEQRAVSMRVLSPEQVLRSPGMGRGIAAAAGAKVRTLDDFQNGSAVEWKFGRGTCQDLQVVESGDAARGKVLKREIQYGWDQAPAALYREIKPGTLAADSQGGIRVWLKSDNAVWVDLGLGSGSRQSVARVRVGTQWQEFRVPFDQFVKPGAGGGPITADELKKADRLTIMPRNDDWYLYSLTLYIDDFGWLEK